MVPNILSVSNTTDHEVTESLPLTATHIQPFDDKDSFVIVNHDYKLVQWRHLPKDVKQRFYEETVFRHQPAAQYNSTTRTRKYAVGETHLVSEYSSNQLSGIFAQHNLERLKGKVIEHNKQK
jgi:hypothetical protein